MSIVFVFTRDLRVHDNVAFHQCLLEASRTNTPVIPVFIMTPKQLSWFNEYRSTKTIEFLKQAIANLRQQIPQLSCLQAVTPVKAIDSLGKVSKIYMNQDLTPYAKKRTQDLVAKYGKDRVQTFEDYTMFPVHTVLTGDNKDYLVFTPFYRKCMTMLKQGKLFVKPLPKSTVDNLMKKTKFASVSKECPFRKYAQPDTIPYIVSREEAFKRLKAPRLKNYGETRDRVDLDSTSRISAYLKYGVISVREAFAIASKTHGLEHPFTRQLFWREFHCNIYDANPRLLQGQVTKKPNEDFNTKVFQGFAWSKNEKHFEAWCKGNTGFPIVDAGMRCLNSTGFMHNRLRMIVASFLVKDLHLNWRKGEKYFASRLIDYDPIQNHAGWVWTSGSGLDPNPYFRIFNPWTQGSKFDPKSIFTRKWIPELKAVPNEDIQSWSESYKKYPGVYTKPIVDHNSASKAFLRKMKKK